MIGNWLGRMFLISSVLQNNVNILKALEMSARFSALGMLRLRICHGRWLYTGSVSRSIILNVCLLNNLSASCVLVKLLIIDPLYAASCQASF